MKTVQVPQKNGKLALYLRDSAKTLDVIEFDGAMGCATGLVNEVPTGLQEGELRLLSKLDEMVWTGLLDVRATEGFITFHLCVKPRSKDCDDDVIRWNSVPRIFSVFDQGYSPLSSEDVGRLLDDMVTFHQIVRAKVHFELAAKPVSVECQFGEQDSLRELSEILLDWRHEGPHPVAGQIVIIQLELFEVTYFILTLAEEADSTTLIVSLTDHVYCQLQRVGRRVPVSGTSLNGDRVLEVCDHGLRIHWTRQAPPNVGEMLPLEFGNGIILKFSVVHTLPCDDGVELGLNLIDYSPEARKAWQTFLLPHQYSLLAFRKTEDHEKLWEHLERTKYIDLCFGDMGRDLKNEIMAEWQHVDAAGPYLGACVIGRNGSDEIATIAVSRVSDDVWVAQTAAMKDDPNNLAYTRCVYGWRTRFILQQPDGKYHVAFFVRDQPFLDRFFRKFYLQQGGKNSELLSWTEWKYYLQFLQTNLEYPEERSREAPAASLSSDPLLRLLRSQKAAFAPKVADFGTSTFVNGRPYLHMCQYFSSLWIDPSESDPPKIGSASEAKFYAIRTAREDDTTQLTSLAPLGEIHPSGWEVVWICERRLLPLFLSNSLRALELMVRKYGIRSVA